MSNMAKASILVVDDTPLNLELLKNILVPQNYVVRTLSNSLAVLDEVLNEPPDLILLDILMPNMDGYEVCRRLKSHPQSVHIPVIFISALREMEEKVEAFDSGGVDYIGKPFQAQEVRARVNTHLHLRALQKSLSATNQQLEHFLKQHQHILNSVGEGIFGLDQNLQITFINPKALTQLGYDIGSLIGHNFHDLIHHPDEEQATTHAEICPIMQIANTGGTQFVAQDSFYHQQGHPFPVEYTVSCSKGAREKGLVIVVFRDISEQLQLKRRIEEAATVFEVSSEGILLSDANGIIQQVNPAFTEITGYLPKDVIGKTPSILKSGHHKEEFYREIWQALSRTGYWEGEIWNRRKDGSIHPEWEMITAISDNQGKAIGYVSQFSNITRRKLTEKEIRYRGNYDALTGLANRSLLMERLEQAIKVHQLKKQQLSLLFLDVDKFKQINDGISHAAGDLLLKQVAERIQKTLGTADTAARLSSDEFVIMLPSQTKQTTCEQVALKLLKQLSKPFELEGSQISIGISIGIAIFPNDGDQVESLLRSANLAMERSKANGGQQVQFFTESMEQEFVENSRLETALRQAMELEQLQVYYQPIIDLKTNEIVGVESLIRWFHPDMGMIPPSKFIPIAEESGLINAIGAWVIATVCQQLAKWHAQGFKLYASVNVSAQQVPHSINLDWLGEQLQQGNFPPESLVLEVTESVFVKDMDLLAAWLRDVRQLGIRVYLDDFGTGYSSLSYLKRFPVDAVKIDQVFVREVNQMSSDQALVRAIIAMSEGLGLQVVAEGIETEAQAQILRDFNCPYGQGYLFSKPLSLLDLESLFKP